MQRIISILVVLSLCWLGSTSHPAQAQAQIGWDVPVDLTVPIAPTPVKADGKWHLVYELHITSFADVPMTLTRLEVLNANGAASPLAQYQGEELADQMAQPGLSSRQVISSGTRAVVFLHITLDQAALPAAVRHRLFFTIDHSAFSPNAMSIEGGQFTLSRRTPFVINPPLAGAGWIAVDSLGGRDHRRTLLPVKGHVYIGQRFAIDWIKIGADGRVFHDDPAQNANWYGYGTELLAVADGVVTAVQDDIPENIPLSGAMAVSITLATIGGNNVLLKLDDQHYAWYAHLQPHSLRVKVGDKVRRGQVLGLLGNSGNSDAPHLHFHLLNANSPLGAEGIPYVLPTFAVQGLVSSLEVFASGAGWQPQPNAQIEQRRMELPVENAVIGFPDQ